MIGWIIGGLVGLAVLCAVGSDDSSSSGSHSNSSGGPQPHRNNTHHYSSGNRPQSRGNFTTRGSSTQSSTGKKKYNLPKAD